MLTVLHTQLVTHIEHRLSIVKLFLGTQNVSYVEYYLKYEYHGERP